MNAGAPQWIEIGMYVPLSEAAILAGLSSRNWCRALCRRGTLPGFKTGGRWWVLRAAALAYGQRAGVRLMYADGSVPRPGDYRYSLGP